MRNVITEPNVYAYIAFTVKYLSVCCKGKRSSKIR